MEEWPDWFKQALINRFNELSVAAEKQEQVIPVAGKVSELLIQMRSKTDGSVHRILLEFEEAISYQHLLEKEWLYFEGLKYGLRLMSPITSSLEDLYPKH
ncbi:hypothetical protein PaeBR_03070 [Paenibacillus sp. BR2-3]|uniref:hypothetical protein n=1 Tax=Paenibacillus sp. BR2-3 TaxID=3048494 RepID=UPI0039777CA2